MKQSLLFFISVLFYACNGHKVKFNQHALVVPDKYNLFSSENLYKKNDTLYLSGRLYSGYIYQLDSAGTDTLLLEGYMNGVLEGVSKKWYKNRQIQEIRYYSKGTKNGKQLAFWENGNKKFEFMAKNDVYEGEMKEWAEKGKLYHLAHYVKGQEEGEQKLWYDNGKIKANYIILNGKRYGLLGTKNCNNVSDSIFNSK